MKKLMACLTVTMIYLNLKLTYLCDNPYENTFD